MAHTALHLAVGLGLGMALAAPALGRAWRDAAAHRPGAHTPLSRPLARLLAGSWGLGLFAIIPNVLRAMAMPEWFCSGWWMNLFLLHPLLDGWVSGGTVIGGFLLVAALSSQYGLLLLAIAHTRRHRRLSAPSAMP
jgi:hypothetical protein